MSADELFSCLCLYLEDTLTYEESRSMGINGFHDYVRQHVFPIHKDELVAGETYKGWSRNACSATWDGEVFHYTRNKFGSIYGETIHHYEDDTDQSRDVFVPIREV